MNANRDLHLCNLAKIAVTSLRNHYRYGAYRAIRDPEGVVSLWVIEGGPKAQFSLSFVDKGRVYHNIDDVPHSFLMSFIEYVRKTVG